MEFDQTLSDAGRERREQILQIAIGAARSRRRRRRATRALCVIAILSLAIGPMLHRSHPANLPIAQKAGSHDAPQYSQVLIEQIPTDPTIADRLSVTPDPRWQQLTDDDLLQSLAAAGRPGGLVHVDGQTILVTDNENQ